MHAQGATASREGNALALTRCPRVITEFRPLAADLSCQKEVQCRPYGGYGSELADLLERRRNRRAEHIRRELEFEPKCEEPAQGQPDRDELR